MDPESRSGDRLSVRLTTKPDPYIARPKNTLPWTNHSGTDPGLAAHDWTTNHNVRDLAVL